MESNDTDESGITIQAFKLIASTKELVKYPLERLQVPDLSLKVLSREDSKI